MVLACVRAAVQACGQLSSSPGRCSVLLGVAWSGVRPVRRVCRAGALVLCAGLPLPVPCVQDATGAAVPATVVVNSLPGTDGSATHSVAFTATLPALGYTTYFITNGSVDGANGLLPTAEVPVAVPTGAASLRGVKDDVVVTNGVITLTFRCSASASASAFALLRGALSPRVPEVQPGFRFHAVYCCVVMLAAAPLAT